MVDNNLSVNVRAQVKVSFKCWFITIKMYLLSRSLEQHTLTVIYSPSIKVCINKFVGSGWLDFMAYQPV